MASNWTTRSRFLLIVAAVILVFNLGRQGYRWFAFADERDQLRSLSGRLDSAALGVMRTQVAADSFRRTIEGADAALRTERRGLTIIEQRANGDGLPPMLYEEYRRGLESYNRRVNVRNSHFERWREVVSRNHEAVDRYNAVADSMRDLGLRMGEPYMSIPSPAEIAVRHGLDSAASFLSLPEETGK